MTITKMHDEKRELHVDVVDPDHAARTESAEFRAAKKRLKEDGHYHCYVCGATEHLQVHHRACEYMFENIVDFDLLKAFVEEWDIYGYGRLLKARPITSADDIRNQMVLCQEHHTGKSEGIHEIPFPEWVIQKLALKGANPVPQKGETIAQAEARVKAHERPD